MTILPAPNFDSTKDIKNMLAKIPHLGFVVPPQGKNKHPHTLLLVGILNRTYELTDSAIWAIDNNRPQTAAHMLRALIETLGFAHYAWDETRKALNEEDLYAKIVSLCFCSRKDDSQFQPVNILTCIDRATKLFPSLRQNYDDLSEVVHPNSTSLLCTGKKTWENGKVFNVEIKVPFYEFRADNKAIMVNHIGETCYYIQAFCQEISENFGKW